MLTGSSFKTCTKDVKAIIDPKMTKYAQATQACGIGCGKGSLKYDCHDDETNPAK